MIYRLGLSCLSSVAIRIASFDVVFGHLLLAAPLRPIFATDCLINRFVLGNLVMATNTNVKKHLFSNHQGCYCKQRFGDKDLGPTTK